MNKYNIVLASLILFALLVPTAMCAINILDITYSGECNTSTITIASNNVSVAFDDIRDFNITYVGPTADACTLDINATAFKITRDSVDGMSLIKVGGTTVTLDINATVVKITRDGNATGSTYNSTAAISDTLVEVCALIHARSDLNCTMATGAKASTLAAKTNTLDTVSSESLSTAYVAEFTPAVEKYAIATASYNTVGEVLTALQAKDDLNITPMFYSASIPSTAFNDLSEQSITTEYCVLTTYTKNFSTGTYTTFGALETGLESITGIAIVPKTGIVSQKFATLGTVTLDAKSESNLNSTAITLTAGGTIYDTHAPFVKATGTLDDVLFCLQLYQPKSWYLPYVKSDGTEAIAVWGP